MTSKNRKIIEKKRSISAILFIQVLLNMIENIIKRKKLNFSEQNTFFVKKIDIV